ncbi:MAG: LysM peptidoglycan-binding domain-containing protein [Nitrososphaerales archaeon]
MQLDTKVAVGSFVVLALIISAVGLPYANGRSGFTYTYAVQSSDTIFSIAHRFKVRWEVIAYLNSIAYPYVLHVGSLIMIPCSSSNINYRVHHRDTIQKIASKFETSAISIEQANGLAYPYTVSKGDILVIPLVWTATSASTTTTWITTLTSSTSTSSSITFASSYSTATSTSTTVSSSSTGNSSSTTTSSNSSNTYTVASGDTLSKIGLMFSVSWSLIAQVNNISSPYTIYPGEVLVIPEAPSSTSTTTVISTSTVGNTDHIATGNALYDQYDQAILAAAAEYGLDPMILKSQMAQESFFNPEAVSPDDPCGQVYQNGTDVGHSYGLLQMTPACNPGFAHNPDGTFDLTTNSTSPQWANSAFNPSYNIYSAAQAWSLNLQGAEQLFTGCTQDQYVYTSLAIYNAGAGSVSSCSSYNSMAKLYIQNILNWYSEFSAMVNWTDPYSQS